MSDQVWYIYQQNQQLGPFAGDQLKQLVDNNMVATDAYFFKVGWKDWRPVEDCLEQIGSLAVMEPASPQRRSGAPRATVKGRVIVHNNGQLVIGSGVNISTTGIFVESADEIFTVGENLKLSVRCDGIARPFNVIAQVIRFNTDPKFSLGYGLQFENLDPNIKNEIDALVKSGNEPAEKDRKEKKA